MNKLTITKWTGDTRQIRFVGYNRDHTACLVLDEQNTRRVITLRLPKLFNIRFCKNPIGRHGSSPIEIKRAALHLPACFASKDEKEAFDDRQSGEVLTAKKFKHFLWKAVTNHKCWLGPENDGKLAELLDEELERQRRLYAIREKETADQIAALPPGDTKGAQALHNELREEFSTVTSGEKGALKFISKIDMPLDRVHHGWAGLREKLLGREWANHFGLNLQTIPTEAAAFHKWLEEHAHNRRQGTMDQKTRIVEIGNGLKLDPWQWEVLEAYILYEIRFSDGTRCWLTDIEERAVTDTLEFDDFCKLEALPSQSTANPKHLEMLAEAHQMLSGGILITNCELVDKMTPQDKLLFNWLVKSNPESPGWAMSYREIAKRLSISHTEVQRRRQELQKIHGVEITRFIAKARTKNDKRMNPDQCDSGRKRTTVNYEPDAEPD